MGGLSPTVVLCAVFFLSGASALIFEVVWFRQAGLVFGNSVWATTLVLSSFMGGLALGNAGVARYGARLRRPVLAYVGLEIAIAVTAAGLVMTLPALPALLAPVFRPVVDTPWILNPLRVAFSFTLLLLPSTAMGATLPVLVKALSLRDPNFGSVLGRLYGWNTLGAVTGALAAELALIGPLGLVGTGLAAASLNLLGGAIAWATAGSIAATAAEDGAPSRSSGAGRRLLAAAFLSGAILLALEVVWFRFLVLFVSGTSLAFAVLLSVVLAGIGAGGLIGARVLRNRADADRWIPHAALASSVLTLGLYAGFDDLVRNVVGLFVDVDRTRFTDPVTIVLLAATLMLPTSLLSGVLFTWIGQAARRVLGAETRTAGLLTLANTSGGMLGSALAGFVLLPGLGVENALVLLSVLYVAVAACGAVSFSFDLKTRPTRALAASVLALALILVAFPYGKMEARYVLIPARAHLSNGMKVVALREGLTETALYLRNDLWGVPRSHRLLTNGFSMASDRWQARRYMKLFVYWPVALHPEIRDALLISYGAGSTARALVDTPGVEHIDVVDISRGVIELSHIVHGEEADPVRDPRVSVHIEDGRFFLLTTERRYDLITGEPPPPAEAGVVNLYTREYFELVHDRLNVHGIVTYWLPLHSLSDDDARAVVRAFCDVFSDCSLWNGMGIDWMLAGSRGGIRPASDSVFREQWKDPRVGPELRELGVEVPEQLGALFLADAQVLDRVVDAPPLIDDRPHRLSSHDDALYAPDRAFEFKDAFEDPELARERFERSAFVRRVWPPGLRERTLDYFAYQHIINAALGRPGNPQRAVDEMDVHRVLTRSRLRTLALWVFRTDPITARIAASDPPEGERYHAAIELHRGFAALADRDYEAAERRFARAAAAAPDRREIVRHRVMALCLAGRLDRAAELAPKAVASDPPTPEERAIWERMEKLYALPSPLSPRAPDASPPPAPD